MENSFSHGLTQPMARSGPQGSLSNSESDNSGRDSKVLTRSQRREKSNNRRHKAWSWIREILIIIVVALVLSFVVKTFFFRAFYIPSGSMENTLQVEDRVLVNQMVPRWFELKRGDVIVFEDPDHWMGTDSTQQQSPFESALAFIGLVPDNSQQHLIKRVIGMPGDRVECCNAEGKMSVNGKILDEPYLYPGSEKMDMDFDVTVPANSLWVMGDHRNASADSRAHMNSVGKGFVPIDKVTGKADVIILPVSRWGSISNQPETFEDIPANDRPENKAKNNQSSTSNSRQKPTSTSKPSGVVSSQQ